LALLHACEIAITTLYPWKVREFAEEEEKSGVRGVFKTLNNDITRVLTTILVTSTAASIFATTLFTHLVASLFGTTGERYGAFALTGLTLFFVELLPKSFGVTNAELVARVMVPPVNVISTIVSPLGISLSWLAKKTLKLVGVRDKGGGSSISDSQLRLIVTGALDSGTIDHGEQEMIQGVLNLQDQRVKEIMRPRVEMIAVPVDMSVVNVLGVVRQSGYSRIPVYDGEIDNIVGIVLAKSVLDFFVNGVLVDEDLSRKISKNSEEVKEEVHSEASSSASKTVFTTERIPIKDQGGDPQGYVRSLTATELASRMETPINEADLVESCYFVPDTANGWSVLQEMRRRRIHMGIVVDEFGGTEGCITLEGTPPCLTVDSLARLKGVLGHSARPVPLYRFGLTFSFFPPLFTNLTDIVEEIVGEIYDEDDEEDFEFSEDSITMQEDGTFIIRGDADLEDCDTILGLKLGDDDSLKDFSTISGFLCMCAGEIPIVGDFIMSRGWSFEIAAADDKKVLLVKGERLIGAFNEEKEEDESSDNPLQNLLKMKLNKESKRDSNFEDANDGAASRVAARENLEEELETEFKEIVADNTAEAKDVERMVESNERKMDLLESIRQEQQQASEALREESSNK